MVVYDDNPSAAKDSAKARRWSDCTDDTGAFFMARVLQYLETPQYLRRALFPMHDSLRFVVWDHLPLSSVTLGVVHCLWKIASCSNFQKVVQHSAEKVSCFENGTVAMRPQRVFFPFIEIGSFLNGMMA